MMKRLFLIILLISCKLAYAGEGMWLPIFLKSLNEAEMKSMGMKISAKTSTVSTKEVSKMLYVSLAEVALERLYLLKDYC
ncbi:MAG: hypothetical protein U0T81_04130 [Saprospiraceae bacterium]